MKVVVTGASGFIGKYVCQHLHAGGHQLITFTRQTPTARDLKGADAVIHLAGEPIAQGRWTTAKKARIYDSRIEGSKRLLDVLATMPAPRPKVLIAASAIGFYGDRGNELLDEDSQPGEDFLADVCHDWERETIGRKIPGLRQIALRIGVVLGRDGGALAKMLLPFKIGLGAALGSGRQWMSWIHIDDLMALFELALTRTDVAGPINAVAPHPAINADFSRFLAEALGTKCYLRAPALALRVALGEQAKLLLSSQRVLPKRANAFGFQFHHSDLAKALKDLV